MAQTLWSKMVYVGCKVILFEKPQALRRIFFSITALVDPADWCKSWISFGDPTFTSHYTFNGPVKHFEAKGEGIFQGDIWGLNASTVSLQYTMTEILV